MYSFISITTFVLALASCNNAHSPASEFGLLQPTCAKRVDIGLKSICLPMITAMSEVSNSKQVMALPGARVSDACTVHGIYLREEQKHDMDAFKLVILDDYFKVYVVNSTSSQFFSKEALDVLVEEISVGAIRRNWNDISIGLESIFEGVRFGQPVLMESYRPSDSVASLVYLIPMHEGNDIERYGLMTLSLCEVNNRLIWVTHYLEYDGSLSVKQSKSKSDYFTLRLIEANH